MPTWSYKARLFVSGSMQVTLRDPIWQVTLRSFEIVLKAMNSFFKKEETGAEEIVVGFLRCHSSAIQTIARCARPCGAWHGSRRLESPDS